MFVNFNEFIKANFTAEGRISTLKTLIKNIEVLNKNLENIGKCKTCKHYIYRHESDSESIDQFINWFCEIKPSSYRVCDYHSCNDYMQRDYRKEINDLQNQIIEIEKYGLKEGKEYKG